MGQFEKQEISDMQDSKIAIVVARFEEKNHAHSNRKQRNHALGEVHYVTRTSICSESVFISQIGLVRCPPVGSVFGLVR